MHKSAALAAVAVACLVTLWSAGAGATAPSPAFRVLVFTKTAGYRHDSIPVAISTVEGLGPRGGFVVDATEDASVFNDANLARYRVVVFLLTTGDVLDADQQAAFTRYIEAGGGFAGVHSAADTEHDWPWYGGLVGAYFVSHPAVQPATIDVVDRDSPGTIHLPAAWPRTDEWYAFQTDPRGSVTVLATLDESTYAPGDDAMGADHPIMWQHAYHGGRSWYFAGGHTSESYAEPLFRSALLGGILWSAGFELPSFESVTARVTGRRLTVVTRHPDCARCTLQVIVRVRGRRMTASAVADGTTTEVSTAALPVGRWNATVVLTSDALAAHVTARRTIQVT